MDGKALRLSQNRWILGIDFGTSNTAAAHTNPVKGNIEAVGLSHNRTTMSSAVYVESPARIDVGDVAVNKAASNPAGFIPAPKRVVPQHMVHANGYDIPASAPVAAVFNTVVQRVIREHADQPPAELVLTHPEAWSTNEIQVLIDAASSLRLPSAITTISEPQAAAHYYTRAHALQPGQHIAVFDFGGGTLDVAVLRATPQGAFEVVSARGDNTLGGKTLDALIRAWVDNELEDRNPELLEYFRTRAPLREHHALEESIRSAKELLSETAAATILVTGGGETERFQLTRAEFEQIIAPALAKAVELTKATLIDAPLTALYLTGGSSRIPIVQETLKQFGKVATLDDPKTVVAQGALAARLIAPGAGAATGSGPVAGPKPVAGPSQAAAPTPQAARGGAVGGASKSKIIAAAAVAVLALGALGGAGAYLLRTTGTHDAQQVAEASSAPTAVVPNLPRAGAGAGAGAEAAVEDAEDAAIDTADAGDVAADSAYSALPAALKSTVSDCFDGITRDTGATELLCTVPATSPDIKYFYRESADDEPLLRLYIDPVGARQQRQNIIDGTLAMPGGATEVVQNAAGTAAAQFYKADVQPSWEFQYANIDSGLMITCFDVKDRASAEEFLRVKGLL